MCYNFIKNNNLNSDKMVLQILEAFIIAGLLVYIIFLHLQLSKKNIFIETTVKKLAGLEKTRTGLLSN